MRTPRFVAGYIMISLKTQVTRIKVPGFKMLKGHFGIHLFLTGVKLEEKFIVTHLPSGLKMPGGPWTDVTLAARYCELVSEIGVDWSLPSVSLTPTQSAEVSNIIGRLTQ